MGLFDLPRSAADLALGVVITAAEAARSAIRPAGQTPDARQRPHRSTRAYDAAATGYRTDGWTEYNTSANAEIDGGIVRVRNRARDLVRNNPHGTKAARSLVSNLVGNGLRPMPQTGDESEDRRVLALWDAWSRRCYGSNRLGIYGVQTLLARSLFIDGEVLIRRRPRLSGDMPGIVPLQLQVLEGDYLDESHSTALDGGRRVVQGVEFDALDRRRAYHLFRTHPGDGWMTSGGATSYDRVAVPASEIVHLYQEERPGQTRGISWFSPVIQALWDLGGYADAERVRKKAEACLVAVVEGGEEMDEPNPDGIARTVNDDGDQVTDSSGNPVEQLRPGWIMYAPGGKKVHFNQPTASPGYAEFMRVSLHEIAAGIGLAYEVLTGDLSQVNFSSIRLGLNEQHRMMRAIREQVFAPLAMDPVWEWFVRAAIETRLLPDRPEFYRVAWSRPGIESVDRLTDAKADLLEMRAGTRSRREILVGYGRDPDVVDEEIAADQTARDELGIVLDSDPRQTTSSGSAQSAGGSPEPAIPDATGAPPVQGDAEDDGEDDEENAPPS